MVSEDDITARGGVLSQDDAATDDATAPAGRGRAQWQLLGVVLAATLAVLGLIAFVALRPGAGTGESGYQTIGAAPADTPPLLRDRDRAEPMPLPDATLPALAGLGPADGLDLSDLRGEPAVINFWASWCAPCLREMPGLQNVADDLGITVIGVDYVDQDDEAVELARELGITYPLVRDDDGDFGRQVGLIGTPTTLFVDADGTIVRQLAAELSEQELREVIEDELL